MTTFDDAVNKRFDARVAEALDIIKMGSVVKKNIIRDAKRECAANILATLRAVVFEQKSHNLIEQQEADYILDSVFDTCLRNGYID